MPPKGVDSLRALNDDDLDRLDDFLCGLDSDAALTLSGLDGFLSGVVVCPDLILPSEWLPVIWGGDGPGFADEREANEILGLIMARYNEIARGLGRKKRHAPILENDIDGAALWELWVEGFATAMALRPDSWDAFEASENENVQFSIRCIASLASVALDGARINAELGDEVRAGASGLIADCLHDMNAARLALQGCAQTAPAPSIGRNDPCPCGSGRKFKKCCLR